MMEPTARLVGLASVSYTHLEDGSKTIWVGETELRHRLKWSVGVSVYPNRSWVEAKIKVINPTPMIPVSYTHQDVYKRQSPNY